MKYIKYNWLLIAILSFSMSSCFNLDEEVFDRVDSSIYYQNENSVKAAVASIYSNGALSYIEYFWYLQEFSADQVSWRSWNGGLWGYDEGEKFVLSTHTWTPDSKIIRTTWETAWTTIGLCNTLLVDLESLDAASLKMTAEKLNTYIGEVRTLRAWAYYNIFEIWGGALPLNISVGTDIPPTADPDFDTSCKKIYSFIISELDDCVNDLNKNDVNRMNQAVNRIIKARLLLNSEVFIKENHYAECVTLCQELLDNKYGTYSIAEDYRDIYSIDNINCPEVIMAFAFEIGQLNGGWMRDMPFLPYNIWDYFGGTYQQSPWNCVCLTPSFDNSGNVNTYGGTDNPKCFLDAPYNDKLGAIYERYDDRDIRKQNYIYDETSNSYKGMFLKGAIKANYGTGEALTADADRDGQPIVYVDQVGTFMNKGRNLEDVMSPRWGETTSGVRLVKYPIYPATTGIDFQDIDEVEFRLSEVVYMLAECKMRAGDAGGAKELVNSVRQRYFSATDWAQVKDEPGRGYTDFDMDWMLGQWGMEFLSEGRRRRTDLRRFDKFTQGQWWFFGRATEDGKTLPAKRDRKYEWYPLPSSALLVNPGLIQNSNYN
ncbi:RagB/SusD family nutrient uptake outer membrane protein [Bacteroides nordii]|uniref:RagB/SusD family nutrient uptake outer membrane protein n=1 Tax=Bacteroides nordii TaxID=291645 RepID=UPI002A839D31|nr:RagB/SusD family nutrient uptake outer membrane protein [Bacteroides nordii]